MNTAKPSLYMISLCVFKCISESPKHGSGCFLCADNKANKTQEWQDKTLARQGRQGCHYLHNSDSLPVWAGGKYEEVRVIGFLMMRTSNAIWLITCIRPGKATKEEEAERKWRKCIMMGGLMRWGWREGVGRWVLGCWWERCNRQKSETIIALRLKWTQLCNWQYNGADNLALKWTLQMILQGTQLAIKNQLWEKKHKYALICGQKKDFEVFGFQGWVCKKCRPLWRVGKITAEQWGVWGKAGLVRQ